MPTIFISKYKNYKLGLRPTVKQHVHTGSGGEDVIIHKGVTVQFRDAVFNTDNWREYERPDSPANINVIKCEEDLINLMKKSPYFGIDFFEREIETPAMKKAKLLAELAKIEAEESANNPENAPELDQDDADIDPATTPRVKTSKRKAPKAKSTAKGGKNKSSTVEL